MGLRIGHGYDVHPYEEGRPLILGGVAIAHPRGLSGHSDADALCHAVADALLGSLALGDLGQHFPDSDPRWKDADSLDILRQVREKIASRGGRPVNVDVTVVADEPKLAPHVSAMRTKIAAALEVSENRVSIKATRTEGVGTLAGANGLAVQAVALVDVTEPGAAD